MRFVNGVLWALIAIGLIAATADALVGDGKVPAAMLIVSQLIVACLLLIVRTYERGNGAG